jgi:hypothetical protein
MVWYMNKNMSLLLRFIIIDFRVPRARERVLVWYYDMVRCLYGLTFPGDHASCLTVVCHLPCSRLEGNPTATKDSSVVSSRFMMVFSILRLLSAGCDAMRVMMR